VLFHGLLTKVVVPAVLAPAAAITIATAGSLAPAAQF
jgi:hypothetical protein